MKISDLHNKKIAILWFWKEWQSCLQFLLKEGIKDITVLDKNPIDTWNEHIQSISWDWYLDDLQSYDVIVKSPGISPFQEKLLPYREKFISGTQIFFSNYTWKVIGLTGTKGKSTCSTLLYEALKALSFDVKLVWNIGKPVLDEIDLRDEHEYVVYELSSYMLQDFSPNLTVWFLNNIYPCHLDWHFDSLSIYKQAKINILRNAEVKIINWELSRESEILRIKDERIYFDSRWSYTYNSNGFFIDGRCVYSWDVALNWEHNKKNITGVIAILSELGINQNDISQALEQILPSFWWLPHRIEDIWVYEGIRFIDDAIATTPESTIAAINTFDWELETLFLGGEDSGFDFKDLRKKILSSSVKNIIAFPDTSEKIFPEISMRDYDQVFEIEIDGRLLQFIKTRLMLKWVDFAYKTTLPWKIALLSCASPSFSLWKSYIQKAEEFKQAVSNY